ncbi:serine/threonine-protein phosphatase 2A regulatory subunit B [Nematocida displodere]|uniref:Serine/threonine-protein phosphatase 2A regulatory subunit B n=1 Tax=Nematocida displodere TaxID=1805483 RepID=A0A177EJV6_9MICR|nr:serine/threonine-protein phosphatase 2A regulatory subunit B [Nematocida displodere]
MFWTNWKCKQTITAASSDHYTSCKIKDGNLILGRHKGFLELYKIGPNLRKRIEFRSHAPCFDYLRSAEIPESVDTIDVVTSGTKELLVITANPKTLKLWNIHASYLRSEDAVPVVECCTDTSSDEEEGAGSGKSCHSDDENGHSDEKHLGEKHLGEKHLGDEGPDSKDATLKTPNIPQQQTPNTPNTPKASAKDDARMERLFAQAHLKKRCLVRLEKECTLDNTYNIHSVSTAPNNESVLVADELSITILNPRIEDPWKVINLKPLKNEELNKIITTAKFVENTSNMFVYGTSSGSVELHDLRECVKSETTLTITAATSGDFYGEIVRPISDLLFMSDTTLACRNLQQVLLYDLRFPSTPVQEYDVYPLVQKKISDLYDTDEIFSRFELCGAGSKLYTGSFNTAVVEIDVKTNEISRAFLDNDLDVATRIVDGKKITCIAMDGDCLVTTIANHCHIFRPILPSAANDTSP